MIVVAGDFHGNFSYINQFINSHPDITMILQCGDFGWWPRFHDQPSTNGLGRIVKWNNYALKNKEVQILWAPGNHEDWESLKNYEDVTEVMPKVFYMPKGSIAKHPDGRNILFMGGGLSIDRKYRPERGANFGWFWEETISQKDLEDLPDENIDIIISHTAPIEFTCADYHADWKDPSRDALSYLLKKYKPKLWYFGHMHSFQTGFVNGCKWTGLSAIGFEGRWWIPLE